MARIISAFTQFLDDNGEPLVDGLLKFYESGTNNTDKDTYADINETIKNTNPVVLDGAGRCPNVFGDGSYNVISYTSASVQIQQFDPVGATGSTGAFSDWDAITIYDGGDIVTGSDGLYYRSIAGANQNQDPISSPGQWEEVTLNQIWNTNVTYGASDTAYGSDGLIYISRIAANLGNDPTTDDANWRLLNDNPNLLDNAGFTAAVATKALTFALKTNDLSDPTAADKVIASFRSATLTTGNYDVTSIAAAASIVVPDGATLGFTAGLESYVYLYLINNASTIELAVSGTILDQTILHTTVAIDATADVINTLYSTTLRTNVAIRILGRIKIETGAVAGEWDNPPSELVVDPTFKPAGASGYTSIQVFTASGTWTKPAGITKIEVEVQGAGGGGSGATNEAGGSGGGGGYAKEIIDVSAISSETITIGAGGSGGNGTTGGTGGTSSFGAHCSATGGAGGPYSVSSDGGGAGGVGSGGDINITGQGGGGGTSADVANYNNGMMGGNGMFSGGGVANPSGTTGGAGTNGGGGASGTSAAGGAGGGGLIVVRGYE